MRVKILILCVFSLVVISFTLTLWAQAEEHKSQLYLFEDVVVKPSMVSIHEAAIKEMVAFSSKYNFPYPWYAFKADDLHYYYVFPMKNLAEIDNMFKAWDEVKKKVPEEQLQAMLKNYWSTYEYSRWGMFRYRPDISYIPENPRLKVEEGDFIFVEFNYIQPGKKKEYEDVLQEWLVLFKKKNLAEGVYVLEGDIGTDMPIYIYILSGKNYADFFNHFSEMWELLGEEANALFKRERSNHRKYEYKTGWFRPNLSYIPKEKQSE